MKHLSGSATPQECKHTNSHKLDIYQKCLLLVARPLLKQEGRKRRKAGSPATMFAGLLCFPTWYSMKFRLSKSKMQRIGRDAEGVFASNPNVSLIGLCDSLAFLTKMVQAGVKSVRDYNPHKAKTVFARMYGTAPHTETIERYVSTLEIFGYAEIDGGTLTFGRIKSSNSSRNVLIDVEDGASVKRIGREIAKYIVTSPMRAIAYVNGLIARRGNPHSLNELKRTRADLRRLGFDAERFHDNGVSYGMLCRRFHICRNTVSELLKRCVKDGLVAAVRNVEGTVIRHAARTFGDISKLLRSIGDSYTYHYYDPIRDILRLYLVRANTYIWNPHGDESLV